ncbi:aromatic aminotransferase Aro8 [Penicillium canescens]|nr:aromatic aminotransferase Aro8 [Penicillium canescens]
MLSFKDIEELRRRSQPLSGAIAPAVSSDCFKSSRCFQKPKSKLLDHLLSTESKSRGAATLKAGGKELMKDIISLSTGRPSPELFPFFGLDLRFCEVPDLIPACPAETVTWSVGKYDSQDDTSRLDLSLALNYGHGAGSEHLMRFITEHVDVVHDPPYSDWEVSLTVGSTSALDMALRMFCTRGDYVLMEEYSYSGAIEAASPLGLRIASKWTSKVCRLNIWIKWHNPTGTTQTLQRRKEIYAVAEKHDLYIIEDDPYYFFQFETLRHTSPSPSSTDMDAFLGHLIPSYLSLDVTGRVLRLDSTSKVLGPGLRCSWMTGSASIISRVLYHNDVSTVSPSGLSQVAMYALLEETWGHTGFVKWLMCLCREFLHRRDVFIQACEKYLPADLCTWQVPASGMFHWIQVNWKAHPLVKFLGGEEYCPSIMLRIEERAFRAALEAGVMCCKGSAFRGAEGLGENMFLRATFATAPLPQLIDGVRRLRRALGDEFTCQT